MLLVVDDLSALVAWTDDMLRLAPRLAIEHESEEEERAYAHNVADAAVSEQRRVWGTYLQRGGQLSDVKGGGSITVLGLLHHAKGAYENHTL